MQCGKADAINVEHYFLPLNLNWLPQPTHLEPQISDRRIGRLHLVHTFVTCDKQNGHGRSFRFVYPEKLLITWVNVKYPIRWRNFVEGRIGGMFQRS
jgi:hypothetical protein